MARFAFIIAVLLTLPCAMSAAQSTAPGQCRTIDDFATGIKPGWKHKSFKGSTQYTWVQEEDRGYVRASSRGTASGLYYEIEYEPHLYPYLTWQWKVDSILENGDAKRKAGDDYSARVYVIFPSLFFWNTMAINYIWANRLPKNEAIVSPFTENSMMVSVESGPDATGRWITETRNIYEDFKRFFKSEPPKVTAIAFMTDSDNTGATASASYGPIAVCKNDPRQQGF